ncbi:MAG TPA: SRPBCC family protein [Puia sp.]
MRFIKFILISGIALFIVLTAFSFLFPSQMRVGRSINIAASREKVMAAVGDLRAWSQWNTFITSTPLTGMTFSSPSSGKDAFLRSDQLRVTVLAAGPDSVRLDWKQTKGKSFVEGFNLLQLQADSLTVQCWFDFHFRWYPWEKLGLLVYDKKLGPVMEESLAGLKRYVENSP